MNKYDTIQPLKKPAKAYYNVFKKSIYQFNICYP